MKLFGKVPDITCELVTAFSWNDTEQKHTFWSHISRGNYTLARSLYSWEVVINTLK